MEIKSLSLTSEEVRTIMAALGTYETKWIAKADVYGRLPGERFERLEDRADLRASQASSLMRKIRNAQRDQA